jgi:hypothetical protein
VAALTLARWCVRGVLIGPGGGPLFNKEDPRLRAIPFMVDEPSFQEVGCFAKIGERTK